MSVIPFRQRPEQPKPHGLMLTTIIDPNAKLEEGDLIAYSFRDDKQAMFWVWYGPTGKDSNGRFCKKGDPKETFATDGLSYSMQDILDGHFKVLGKAILGLGPAQPCPKVWRTDQD